MYHVFDNVTIHFYKYQDQFFVANWKGGNVIHDKWDRFLEEIITQTGVDAIELNKAATEYFGPQHAKSLI